MDSLALHRRRSNGLFLVEVLSDGRRGFGFLPLTALNLAWARGETERAVHEVRVAWWAH